MPDSESAGSRGSHPSRFFNKLDQLQYFTTSFDATLAMESRPKVSGSKAKSSLSPRNKAIGGGRLGKSTRGWHLLPNSITHQILDHVIEEADMIATMENAWNDVEKAKEIASMICIRRTLCEMRLISSGWQHGVDSHLFWPSYTLALDPSKYHSSTVADLRSSRTTPSTPSYPSLFHRARSLTLKVCLPCRLNHPDRLGLYPAQAKAATYSNHLGIIPTCHRHRDKYCSCCLREENDGLDSIFKQVTLQVRRGDIDNKGDYYFNPIVCDDCREEALLVHINKELAVCARGGPVPQGSREFLDTLQAQEYISIGHFNVIQTARFAVREQWINKHTVFPTLEPFLLDLQRCENEIKRGFIYDKRLETDEMRAKRVHLLHKLYDETARDLPELMTQIIFSIEEQYEEWNEDDDLEFEDDDDLQLCDIRQFTGQDAACYRWVRDRIRSGYWVFPSTELETIINPTSSPITPRDVIISSARLPLGILQTTFKPYYDTALSHDLIIPNDKQSFLPPQSVVEALDEWFHRSMKKLLYKPCQSKMMEHLSCGFDAEEFEDTRMSTAGMLEYLGDEEAWRHILPYRPPISFPISAPIWIGGRSPRIEQVPVSDDESDNGFIVEIEDEEGVSVEEEEEVDEEEAEDEFEEEDGQSFNEEDEEYDEEGKEEEVMESKEHTEESQVSIAVTDSAKMSPTSTSNHKQIPADIGNGENGDEIIGENRKRKSPPLPISRAPKRRSSDDHQDLSSPHNHDDNAMQNNHDQDNANNLDNHKDNDNDHDHGENNQNDKSNESLPSRNTSQESLTSSDTQPVTPPRERRALELRRKQRERAEKEPRVALSEVPHIPALGTMLGIETEEIFKRAYESAILPYISCRCTVCMRGYQRIRGEGV